MPPSDGLSSRLQVLKMDPRRGNIVVSRPASCNLEESRAEQACRSDRNLTEEGQKLMLWSKNIHDTVRSLICA